ncbi:hypothetical protein BDW59DRAFT_160044 [Aspergillus cavernicola]|uniref:Uncharacterized protein n=1 Tax=Aspergillus cavernicola TaxID=176166 RepID=A0ABR4IIY7_9EURO
MGRQVEHVTEIKKIKQFLDWAQNNPKCNIDCDMIVDFHGQDVIENPNGIMAKLDRAVKAYAEKNAADDPNFKYF